MLATDRSSDAEVDEFVVHSLSTSGPEHFYDEDKSLDGSDSDNMSSIVITILIITISFVCLSVLIVMFIRYKAFFIPRSKGIYYETIVIQAFSVRKNVMNFK